MALADDIESFWLSAPSLRSADPGTTSPSHLDRAYSQESSALSHAPSLGASISRHPSTSEGGFTPCDDTIMCNFTMLLLHGFRRLLFQKASADQRSSHAAHVSTAFLCTMLRAYWSYRPKASEQHWVLNVVYLCTNVLMGIPHCSQQESLFCCVFQLQPYVSVLAGRKTQPCKSLLSGYPRLMVYERGPLTYRRTAALHGCTLPSRYHNSWQAREHG